MGLNEADVKAIEAPILAQVETHQIHLRQYEQTFTDTIEQEYPLSQLKRSELRKRQQSLSLSAKDIEPIENRIIDSIEDHLKKLQQYEQVFSDSIQFEFPVSEDTRKELRRFQQILELGNAEVAQLEETVVSPAEQHQNAHQQSNTVPTVNQSSELNTQKAQKSEVLQEYEIEVANYINHEISPEDDMPCKKLNSLQNAQGLTINEAQAIEVKLDEGTQLPHSPKPSNTKLKPIQSSRVISVLVGIWVISVLVGIGILGLTIIISQFLAYQPRQPSTSASKPSPSKTTGVFPISESKIAQCNKIIAVVKKMGVYGDSFYKKTQNADRETLLVASSEAATKMDGYVEELQVIELEDDKLKAFQRNLIEISRDTATAYRGAIIVATVNENDENAKKALGKSLQNVQLSMQLANDFDKYCQTQ